LSWSPPPIKPDSYRILTGAGDELRSDVSGGANSTIITGMKLGQPITFVVEAVSAAGRFQSAPSNPVVAFGSPGGPTIQIVMAARSPTTLTLRVTVDATTDGGSPVTTYDLRVESGRVLLNVMGVPIGQRPYQFTATCADSNDPCLGGGTVVATATLYNAAGAGPPNNASAAIPAPPAFAYRDQPGPEQPFRYVSTGGKCFSEDFRLHTCTGSAGQLWEHYRAGYIVNQSNGQCLVYGNLHYRRIGDGCSERDSRWKRVPPDGNEGQIRGQYGAQECLYVNGDPAGDGTPVLSSRQCPNGPQDRWFAWRPEPGVPMTAAQPAAFVPPAAGGAAPDSALGGTATALLLLPLAAGLARRRRGRRSA
jgi:hypothetical protein